MCKVRKPTHLAVRRSYSVAVSTRSTTTRSIQLLGNRSHACQSIMQPPCLASCSMASSSYSFPLALTIPFMCGGMHVVSGDEVKREK